MSTHPFWKLPIEGTASLLLTPCPGIKGCELGESLEQLKAAGAVAVFTALEPSDLPGDGLNELARKCAELGLEWFHLPIEDDMAPGAEFEANWSAANQAAQAYLDAGKSLAIHCKGGSGRTGLIALRIMHARGLGVEPSMTQIKALRPGAFTRQAHLDYLATLAR